MHFSRSLQGSKPAMTMRPVSIESILSYIEFPWLIPVFFIHDFENVKLKVILVYGITSKQPFRNPNTDQKALSFVLHL